MSAFTSATALQAAAYLKTQLATAPVQSGEGEIPQPDQNGEFTTPLDGALWMALTYNIPQTPLNGKIPFLSAWQNNCSADPAVIRTWSARHPGCNFGSVAVLGKQFIFEADSLAVRERFKNRGHDFTSKLIIESSPGKGHRYYLSAPGVENIGQNKGEDFSVRANGEQCVSPGSIHPLTGKQYRVAVNNGPLTQPTAEEITFWNSEREKPEVKTDEQARIPSGQRNSALNTLAGKYIDFGETVDQVKERVRTINTERCDPPLSDTELENTIFKSVVGYAKKPDSITRKINETPLIAGVPVGTASTNQSASAQVKTAETDRLVAAIRLVNPGLDEQEIHRLVRQIKTHAVVTEDERINPSQSAAQSLDYLPSSVLTSTRLGDIYMESFEPHDWPLALALPALVTAASVVVPRPPRQEGSMLVGDDPMTNLYTALIADVNAGKSQVINWAATAIGIYEPPVGSFYFEGKFGSAEQMLKSLHRKQQQFANKSVLVNPDEWAHLFAKAAIPDASFPTVLTTSFYRRNQVFTLGGTDGGKEYALNLQLSFIGGIVEQDFDTVFGANTLGGLYDRFLFGRAPDGFRWNYCPCPIEGTKQWANWNLKPVRLDGSVFEVLKSWGKKNPSMGRVAEVCSRIATIFASVDGRPEITGKDIEPLEPLALYQVGLRQMFRPNAGVTPEAMFANKALDWTNKHGAEWVSISRLKQHLFRLEERLGPNVAERALASLARGGRIDLWLRANGDGERNPPPSDYNGPRAKIGLVRRVR